MIIGVPRELKDHETRVGLVPSGVRELTARGHRVLIEAGAGEASSISDDDFRQAGAELISSADELWKRTEMVVKVKEPIAQEYRQFRPDLLLFAYLHLAPLPELTRQLLERKVCAIAYETVRAADGSLPLLEPMSEVAGRMSVQVGAQYLEQPKGGRGILLGGVPGVPPARVVILGGGIVGTNAARVALGMGATVLVLEKSPQRMRQLDDLFGGRVITIASNRDNVAAAVRNTDLLIGAVLIPGASAPRLVTRAMVATMKRGAVIVDVAIDQGGCVETAYPTSHTDPAYSVDGVVHYCVTNMPAAVPRTSTFALTNATYPYVQRLADQGLRQAVAADEGIAQGVNTCAGYVTQPGVAAAQQLHCRHIREVLT